MNVVMVVDMHVFELLNNRSFSKKFGERYRKIDKESNRKIWFWQRVNWGNPFRAVSIEHILSLVTMTTKASLCIFHHKIRNTSASLARIARSFHEIDRHGNWRAVRIAWAIVTGIGRSKASELMKMWLEHHMSLCKSHLMLQDWLTLHKWIFPFYSVHVGNAWCYQCCSYGFDTAGLFEFWGCCNQLDAF